MHPVIEYAKWLGMDLEYDKDLFWVAREGLMVSTESSYARVLILSRTFRILISFC